MFYYHIPLAGNYTTSTVRLRLTGRSKAPIRFWLRAVRGTVPEIGFFFISGTATKRWPHQPKKITFGNHPPCVRRADRASPNTRVCLGACNLEMYRGVHAMYLMCTWFVFDILCLVILMGEFPDVTHSLPDAIAV